MLFRIKGVVGAEG